MQTALVITAVLGGVVAVAALYSVARKLRQRASTFTPPPPPPLRLVRPERASSHRFSERAAA